MLANKESKQSYITLITSWTSIYTPLVYQCLLSIILTSPPLWLMTPVSSGRNICLVVAMSLWPANINSKSMTWAGRNECCRMTLKSGDKADWWVSSQTPSKQGKHFYERSYHSLNFIRIWLEKPTFLMGALGSSLIIWGLGLVMVLKFCIRWQKG